MRQRQQEAGGFNIKSSSTVTRLLSTIYQLRPFRHFSFLSYFYSTTMRIYLYGGHVCCRRRRCRDIICYSLSFLCDCLRCFRSFVCLQSSTNGLFLFPSGINDKICFNRFYFLKTLIVNKVSCRTFFFNVKQISIGFSKDGVHWLDEQCTWADTCALQYFKRKGKKWIVLTESCPSSSPRWWWWWPT